MGPRSRERGNRWELDLNSSSTGLSPLDPLIFWDAGLPNHSLERFQLVKSGTVFDLDNPIRLAVLVEIHPGFADAFHIVKEIESFLREEGCDVSIRPVV